HPPAGGASRRKPFSPPRFALLPRSETVAQQRLAMRKIKDILRLHLLAGVSSCRRIARATGCGKTTVAECLQRASAAGLTSWDVVESLEEDELEQRLYPVTAKPAPRPKSRPLPDWVWVREELARRDHKVTLMLLWTEYKAEHPSVASPSSSTAAATRTGSSGLHPRGPVSSAPAPSRRRSRSA